MFRQSCVAFVVVVALGSLCVATAEEPKASSGKNQITNSIGCNLLFALTCAV